MDSVDNITEYTVASIFSVKNNSKSQRDGATLLKKEEKILWDQEQSHTVQYKTYKTYYYLYTFMTKHSYIMPINSKFFNTSFFLSVQKTTFWEMIHMELVEKGVGGGGINLSPNFLTFKEPKDRFQGINSWRAGPTQPYSYSAPGRLR